jgi:hypothetical protein
MMDKESRSPNPYSMTMRRASCVALWMSEEAPLVTSSSPKMSLKP